MHKVVSFRNVEREWHRVQAVGLQVPYLCRSCYGTINIGQYLCRELVTHLRTNFDENILNFSQL